MPGNEVGDRIHNFFGQENLSQGQHHSQVVDGAWPAVNNNPWVGSQRQIGAPLVSNLKNYNIQQSADSERGFGGQTSSVQHGLNFSQSTLGPEFSRSQSQHQQPVLNGYVHGHQVFQTRQNEANFLGVDTESDRQNLTSGGLSILNSQLGNGPEHLRKNSVGLESAESPVNYDFFGVQQQLSGQHPSILQHMPRQQSGMSDMQLLHQQVRLKQMQEFQRQQQQQQQLQQQEVRQLSNMNQVSSIAKQGAGNPSSTLINGIPIHDASNYLWQPELVAVNTNWLQRGASPVMQGSSSGLMLSPEQGQSLRMLGMVPQQVDQSLYGVPVSGTKVTPSQCSPIQMEKPIMQQISASSNSFPANQYPGFPDQASMPDGSLVSRQGYQGKNGIGLVDDQGLSSGLNLENLHQPTAQQRNGSMQEFHGRQDMAGPSETSQDKMVMQVVPSQTAATLDPTEEKILFGSDDNVWDAFGRTTNMGSGGYNMSDGADFFGGLPSVQSGSWSALMQSAVAETSSGHLGLQEEWSGLTYRNAEPASGNQQPSTVNDSGKQPSSWTDNNLRTSSALNSRPFPLSDDVNTGINYGQTDSSQKFTQQLPGGGTKWFDRGPPQKSFTEGNYTYRNTAQPLEAESSAKRIAGSWMNQQSISSHNSGGQLGNRPNGWNFLESVSPSVGSVLKNPGNENSLQHSLSNDHKSTMLEEIGHGAGIWKTGSFSNATVDSERVKSGIGSPQVNREISNLNNVSALSDSNSIRVNQEECSQQLPNNHKLDIWKNIDCSLNSKGNAASGSSQRHLAKSPQIFESSGDNGSGNGTIGTHEMGNPSVKENTGESFRSNMSHHTSTGGSRENVWLDAGDSRSLPGGKQKSSGNIVRKPTVTRKFQYHPMGDVDVDVESSYGARNATHSQTTAQQVSRGLKIQDQGYFGQSKFPGTVARNSMEIEKTRLPGFQGDPKGSDEMPLKSMLPGSLPSTSATSASFERAIGNYAPNKATPSSQNMLELLNKVDQPKEHGTATPFSSSDRNQSSEMPEAETSDGSVGHLQQNRSSASQGFGLQLAPPSQRFSVLDRALSAQSPSQTANCLSSDQVAPGGKGHTWFAPTTSVQSLPSSRETSQVEPRNNFPGPSGQTGNKGPQHNVQGNLSAVFTPGFPYLRNQLQNQHMSAAGGQVTSHSVSFDRFASQSKQRDDSLERPQTSQSHNALTYSAESSQVNIVNQTLARDSTQQFPLLEAVPASQPHVTSGISQQGDVPKKLQNMWTSIASQQRSSGVQPSNLLMSHLESNVNTETSFSVPQKMEVQNTQKGRDCPSESGACSMDSQSITGEVQPAGGSLSQQVSPEIDPVQKTTSALQGKESVAKRPSDVSLSNRSATQRDIEAFGRSLRPNNVLHPNYSLLHQVQVMKGTGVDPSDRSVKRFKGPDGDVDARQMTSMGGQQFYGYNTIVRDASTNRTLVPSIDSKVPSFSSQPADNQNTNAASQDVVALGQNDSQNFANSNSVASARGENSQISPQMAPSWFDQYGTFKNGQMLSIYDARKTTSMKNMEQPVPVPNPSNSLFAHHSMEQVNAATVDASQLGNAQKSPTSLSIVSERFSSPQLVPPAVADQNMVVLRAQKRKNTTFNLMPWHKEVMQGLHRLQNMSMAEVDWAWAANRLIEKVEDEAEMIEDGPPVLKSKRRLILTTKLMQLLLRPPPAALLSTNASSYYESVAYFFGRSVLGDACSTVSCSRNDTSVIPDCGNTLHENVKTFENIGNQYYAKVMENLIGRARKLENELLRLDKRASVLDIKVECQDLEKYSVINRFAKFHGRGQADGAETSSSSDANANINTNAQKSFPQRYVTALPMPRNLPDRVQCLSL